MATAAPRAHQGGRNNTFGEQEDIQSQNLCIGELPRKNWKTKGAKQNNLATKMQRNIVL